LAGTPRAKANDRELQGNWSVVSLFRDGTPVRANGCYTGILIYDNKIVFGNLLTDARTLTYRTDRGKSPKHIDILDEQGKKVLEMGIYEIKDGVLRLCLGKSRPDAFETKKNDGRSLFVVKKKDKG
jgi:uncharacterized protein (TIGR03067 family)